MMQQMSKQLPEADQAVFRDPNMQQIMIDGLLEAFKQGVSGPACEMKLFFKPWGFELDKIVCPVTIWYGTLDKQVPRSHAQLYANTIPNVQLNIIEGEGHHSLLRNHIRAILKNECRMTG